jgi:XRE family transcriptional regulator, aerobic/anaerobic benzoate catabolism transcriptional regulator
MLTAMKETKSSHLLLAGIGSRVRSLRQARALTGRELALRANLSLRFVSQIEAGEANVSIAKLDQMAQALGCAVTDLIAPAESDRSLRARTWRLLSQYSDNDWQALHEWLEQRNGATPERQFIALIGLYGAGKSTVGPMLAQRLKTEFIELDHWVEEAAGLSLAQIFTTYGEAYYHQLQRKALAKLFAVWLHATPQEFLKRMIKAGETRLTQRPTVMADLKALLARREPHYAEASLTVKTTGKTPSKVTASILAALAESRKS